MLQGSDRANPERDLRAELGPPGESWTRSSCWPGFQMVVVVVEYASSAVSNQQDADFGQAFVGGAFICLLAAFMDSL
jgi:hypothetical protein